METYLQTYVLNGGPLMVFLMACSLLLVGSIVQLFIHLRSGYVLAPELMEQAAKAANKNDRLAFLQAVKEGRAPLARALKLTFKEIDIRAGHQPHRRQTEPIVTEAVANVADDLYEEIGKLATIYTIAPLLGLLGTILGMMSAFREFAAIEQKDLTSLSNGIQEALVTTLWGLGIAIIAFIAAQAFQSRVRRYERLELPDLVFLAISSIFANRPTTATAPVAPAAAKGAASSPAARPAPQQRQASPAPAPPATPSEGGGHAA